MKVFQAIMSLLLLAALLVPAYAAIQNLREKKELATPLPLEQFRTYLEKRQGTPVEFLGWTKPGESCQVLVKRTYPDTNAAYGVVEHFVKMQTAKGSQWFYNFQGDYLSIGQ